MQQHYIFTWIKIVIYSYFPVGNMDPYEFELLVHNNNYNF